MTQVIPATGGPHAPVDLHALAASAGIAAEHVIPHGRDVAKIDLRVLDSSEHVSSSGANTAHYVVVTAITPTPFGEGKTTTAIGLAQGLTRLGEQAVLTLRQSAMGPTFGIKGGAGGSGGARILPAERMNLHLTGDFHAITAAHNLLSAMIDITPASELMVIMSLATDLADLRKRLGRIVIGRSRGGEWISAEDLKAAGAMCAVLRDALEPNLLRTGEGTPVLVHTGPFGNIATGCSSVIADRVAAAGARDGGYILTEAGFGSDMGLERFVDLKCAVSGMHPSAAVVVVTIRALKAHSGRYRLVSGKDLPEEMLQEKVEDVRTGAANLLKHLQIVRGFGITPVVAINVFPTDHDSEVEEVRSIAREAGARVAVCHPVTRGGEGCLDLASAVVEACRETGDAVSIRPVYEPEDDLRTKISKVAALYGADGVDYTSAASRLLDDYERGGFGGLPVIVAKTPLSLSAEPGLKGVPTGWRLPVREVRLAAGAGYVCVICGSLSTMPGLSSRPAAERIDVDVDTGEIVGLH